MHTRKHLVWSKSNDYYEASVYSSGGVTHTCEITCVTSGQTEKHTFRGPDARKNALYKASDFLRVYIIPPCPECGDPTRLCEHVCLECGRVVPHTCWGGHCEECCAELCDTHD